MPTNKEKNCTKETYYLKYANK